MIILHCLKESTWDSVKNMAFYGKESVAACGFIHCSSIEDFWRVAPNFKEITDHLLLLYIEADKVEAEIKWEDDGNYGREYPHIYGELNLDAVMEVVPLLKDGMGEFILNFK